MWAVVPLKSPERAKSRLAGALNPAQRQHLLFELGKRVIDALQATRGIEAVAVVTASAEVAAFAKSLGAHPILQTTETGTAAAFSAALQELEPLRLDSVLMIAGDLPLVSVAAIERIITARDDATALIEGYSPPSWGRDRERVLDFNSSASKPPSPPPSPTTGEGARARASAIIVPDRHRIGTNALLCSPPSALAPCFGSDSFRRHLGAAQTLGINARVLEIDELALDLDCAADLDELRLRGHSAESLFDSLQNIDTELETQTRRVAGVSR
jgi:2-phospho-L-lactate guanylyltransferase